MGENRELRVPKIDLKVGRKHLDFPQATCELARAKQRFIARCAWSDI